MKRDRPRGLSHSNDRPGGLSHCYFTAELLVASEDFLMAFL